MKVIAAFAMMVMLSLLPGCSSFNSGGRTLKQVDMDVSWKMTNFRNADVFGAMITAGERQKVNTAYSNYQDAYADALKAANNNRDTRAPDDVKALATKVIGTIDAIPF